MNNSFWIEAIGTFEDRHQRPVAPPAVIHPGERKALYARELLLLFEQDALTRAAVQEAFSKREQQLNRLLLISGQWDGQYQPLKDALMLGYSGFTALEDIERFGRDIRIIDLDGEELLQEASQILAQVGLKCDWAGPAMLAALLTHAMWESHLPKDMMRLRAPLWPEAGRTVLDVAPKSPTIAYDPTSESKAGFALRARTAMSDFARSTEQRHFADGYVRFGDAQRYRRDALATFLRIHNPTRWTWEAITTEVFEPEQSVGAAQAAVKRVTTLLQIALPLGRSGRPRAK